MENSSQQSTSPVAGNSTRHPTFPDLGNSTQQSSSPEGPDLSSMTYADLVDLRKDAVRKGDIPLRTEVNKELASEGRKAERKREYGRRYRAKNKEKLRKDYEDLQAKRHEEASRIFDEERERDRQRHLEMMARRAAKAAKVQAFIDSYDPPENKALPFDLEDLGRKWPLACASMKAFAPAPWIGVYMEEVASEPIAPPKRSVLARLSNRLRSGTTRPDDRPEAFLDFIKRQSKKSENDNVKAAEAAA